MRGLTAITRRRLALGAGAITFLGVAAFTAPPALAQALAYLAPVLLLLLALVARRYPGERALLALVERRLRGRTCAQATTRKPRPWVWFPRGGRLIAFSLAKRPPPAVVSPP
jgi:hypothetical protein